MPREQINYPPKFTPRLLPDDGNTPAVHGESWPDPTVHVSWVAGRDFGGRSPRTRRTHVTQYIAIIRDSHDEMLQCFGPYVSELAATQAIERLKQWPALKKSSTWIIEPLYADPSAPATISYPLVYPAPARDYTYPVTWQVHSPQHLPFKWTSGGTITLGVN